MHSLRLVRLNIKSDISKIEIKNRHTGIKRGRKRRRSCWSRYGIYSIIVVLLTVCIIAMGMITSNKCWTLKSDDAFICHLIVLISNWCTNETRMGRMKWDRKVKMNYNFQRSLMKAECVKIMVWISHQFIWRRRRRKKTQKKRSATNIYIDCSGNRFASFLSFLSSSFARTNIWFGFVQFGCCLCFAKNFSTLMLMQCYTANKYANIDD